MSFESNINVEALKFKLFGAISN